MLPRDTEKRGGLARAQELLPRAADELFRDLASHDVETRRLSTKNTTHTKKFCVSGA